MAKNGRPTKYKVEYVQLALWMARAGRTDDEVSEEFGVSRSTLNEWKKKHPEFSDALKEGRKDPDDQVEHSLFQRAVGYEYEEKKLVTENGASVRIEVTKKQRAPDVTAQIFWLKNRRPDKWRDRHDIDAKLQGTVNVVIPAEIKDV